MQVRRTDRGFELLEHEVYPPVPHPHEPGRLKTDRIAQASSAIGNYPDSFDRPGSSYLWVGDHHHLNREEVRALISHLSNWVATGSLGRRSELEAGGHDR